MNFLLSAQLLYGCQMIENLDNTYLEFTISELWPWWYKMQICKVMWVYANWKFWVLIEFSRIASSWYSNFQVRNIQVKWFHTSREFCGRLKSTQIKLLLVYTCQPESAVPYNYNYKICRYQGMLGNRYFPKNTSSITISSSILQG